MPDRKIGVALFGTGFARSTQIPCLLATPGLAVMGVVSRTRERAAEVQKEFGLPEAWDDADAMLADPRVELVIVASPPHLHLPQSLAALRAGKHVICEKPTALHAGEALEMLAAARGSGRLHLLDHELRFHPRRRRLGEMVRDGFVGAAWSLEYRIAGGFRVDPARPWSWWSDGSRGGGALGALGSHVVDSIRSWMGEITEVRGTLATMVGERPDPESGEPRPVTSDDAAWAWLRLAGGGLASVTILAAAREEPGQEVRLHGEKGSLRLDDAQRLWQRAHDAGEWKEVACEDAPRPLEHTRVPDNMWGRSFLLLAAAVREALLAGRTTVPGAATFEDGWRNQVVLDALRESAKRGDWVAVEPAAGRP